jgi:hypothetical protein
MNPYSVQAFQVPPFFNFNILMKIKRLIISSLIEVIYRLKSLSSANL